MVGLIAFRLVGHRGAQAGRQHAYRWKSHRGRSFCDKALCGRLCRIVGPNYSCIQLGFQLSANQRREAMGLIGQPYCPICRQQWWSYSELITCSCSCIARCRPPLRLRAREDPSIRFIPEVDRLCGVSVAERQRRRSLPLPCHRNVAWPMLDRCPRPADRVRSTYHHGGERSGRGRCARS